MKMEEVRTKELHRLEEYEECVRLQGEAWGFAPLEIVPVPLFVVAAETGGQVFGAFAGGGVMVGDAQGAEERDSRAQEEMKARDGRAQEEMKARDGRAQEEMKARDGRAQEEMKARDGRAQQETMVGFLMALAGVRDGQAYLHSHMTAVVEGWRDRGVARRLKLLQREDAMARGMELVEWTFDPLEVKNGYFNLVKLGAVVRRYIPNCYGRTTSPLHGRLPTDRLVAEWWLGSERVTGILGGRAGAVGAEVRRIRVAGNMAEMKRSDAVAAEREQTRVREEFERALGEGWEAVGMEREGDRGGVYVMQKRQRQ